MRTSSGFVPFRPFWVLALVAALSACGSSRRGGGGGGDDDAATDDDTTAGDDDTSVADDDTTVGDDDTSVGDDDTSVGDDDTTVGDDDTTVGDDDTTMGDDDTAGGTDEWDIFEITTDCPTDATATLTWTDGNTDMDLYVFDPTDTTNALFAGELYQPPDPPEEGGPFVAPEVFQVQVHCYMGAGDSYEVAINFGGCSGSVNHAEVEPNDDPTSGVVDAFSTTADIVISGTLDLCPN